MGTLSPERRAVLGGDFRKSTLTLMGELKRGLMDSGVHVIDLGQLSTPGYYFARRHLGIDTGVMVTASHSPAQWNGFKPVLGALPITPEEILALRQVVVDQRFQSGSGTSEQLDIKPAYVDWLAGRFGSLRSTLGKIVLDCGSGATGWAVHEVIQALGLEAVLMSAEPDGTFPHRSPDISGPRDLAALQVAVSQHGARIGFGFDGDGDRLGVVDELGKRVSSDKLIAWMAQKLLQQAPGGTIVYDLKLSRLVPESVTRAGGVAIPQKSGHTFIKSSVIEHQALFGGEYSGHLMFGELHGTDDAFFGALHIAELLAHEGKPFSQVMAALPTYYSTPEIRLRYAGDASHKTALIAQAAAQAEADGAQLVLLDGVRAEYAEGWALMRASVTEAAFTLRFEGKTRGDMLAVARQFVGGLGDFGRDVWMQVEKLTANE
jgi:phosphomannomutase/phosphoglucomutase